MPQQGMLEIDEAALEKEVQAVISGILLDGVRAVKKTTRELEKDFENITRATVRGNAWRAWKSRSFPKAGVPAYDPQGIVFVNGGKRSKGMVRYYTTEGTNRAKGNEYLTIPLAAALNTSRGKDISPRQWEGRNGVKLRPFFRPGETALLVADGAVTSTGAFQALPSNRIKAKQRGGQNLRRITVPVFALITEQDHANTVNLAPAIRKAETALVADFLRR